MEGLYTLTLVAVTNVNGTTADFTSTLETMVDDIEDGTSITCNVLTDEGHLTVSKIASNCCSSVYCFNLFKSVHRSPISTT